MSRLNINNLTNENEDGSPRISGISTFSSPHYFVPPSGTTAERPSDPGEGMIRFNTDSGHLEYYTGEFWDDVIVANNELDGGARGLFIGGINPSSPGAVNTIDYITISTLGNALDFGDLLAINTSSGACSSSTRGLNGGGSSNTGGSETNTIEFITISSTGNAQDFGDLTQRRGDTLGRCSSSTRGLWANGYTPSPGASVNTIDYVTIASTGNAVDFGDTIFTGSYCTGFSSSTRGIFTAGSTNTNLNYVTIATTGNASYFGDLSQVFARGGGCSNSTRGLVGSTSPGGNSIDFVTIATLGNGQDFGDLTSARREVSSTSSSVRGIFAGGNVVVNIIEYVTILTTGNAIDFGDLTDGRRRASGLSNGHGGL